MAWPVEFAVAVGIPRWINYNIKHRRKKGGEQCCSRAFTPMNSRFQWCNFPPLAASSSSSSPMLCPRASPAPLFLSRFLLLVVFTRENGANLYLISMKNYAGETGGEPSPALSCPPHYFSLPYLELKLVRACSLLFRPTPYSVVRRLCNPDVRFVSGRGAKNPPLVLFPRPLGWAA